MTASAIIERPITSNGYRVTRGQWRLFCSHGTILFYLVKHPGCTGRQIADALALTPRTVWGLVGDLRRAGLITVHREGRRHYYTVDMEGRFPDPILSHLNLGEAMRAIEAASSAKASTTEAIPKTNQSRVKKGG
jgi:predicted transcriptional regulator